MLESFVLGTFFYLTALFVVLFIYPRIAPLSSLDFFVIFLSLFGHFLGAYLYSLIPSDSSLQFFPRATPNFNGLGTQFVETMVWYIREYITGDSYLGTLFFFSAFAFLGSVLWYLLFLRLTQQLAVNNNRSIFSAVVIMCWPSFLFFTAGIGKDSLSFFLIPLIFLAWDQLYYQRKKIGLMIIIIVLAMTLLTMIRPYLLMIFSGAYLCLTFKSTKKFNIFQLMLVTAFSIGFIYIVLWVLKEQVDIEELDSDVINNRAVLQQIRQNSGTHFPMLSERPEYVILLLPYSFIMNLTFPLFLLARNITGYLSSVENLFLVYLLWVSFKKRKLLKIMRNKNNLVNLCFYFFIIGMSFLALINTNLGLSVREKSMYLPPFLIIAMLLRLLGKKNKRIST